MTNEQIKEIALANGFKLKEQPDGSMDLNPYVYSTIRDAVAKFGGAQWVNYRERRPIEKGEYLIRDGRGRVAIGVYDKFFEMESGGENWGCVTHWMPLPKPPSEVNDES